MRRLWLCIYAAAALLENDTRPLCRDVRIHDDPKKREGYGNQIHALVFAAEFALPFLMWLLLMPMCLRRRLPQ